MDAIDVLWDWVWSGGLVGVLAKLCLVSSLLNLFGWGLLALVGWMTGASKPLYRDDYSKSEGVPELGGAAPAGSMLVPAAILTLVANDLDGRAGDFLSTDATDFDSGDCFEDFEDF